MTDILNKIAKLAALANDRSISEEEAKNYAEKMSRLMMEHRISEGDLAEAIAAQSNDGVALGYGEFTMKYQDQWRRHIYNACAVSCGTSILYYRKIRPPKVEIYGHPDNIQATHEMFQFLEQQVVRISRELYPKDAKNSRQAQRGLGLGVAQRLYESHDAVMEELKNNNKENLPILVDQEDAVRRWRDEQLEKRGVSVRLNKHRPTKSTPASRRGYEASERVQLRTEL